MRNKRFWFQYLTATFGADLVSMSSSLSTNGKQTLKIKLCQRSVLKKTSLQLLKGTVFKPTLIQTTELLKQLKNLQEL